MTSTAERSAQIIAGARAALPHIRFDDDARLVAPTVGGTRGLIIVHLEGARWALPRGIRVSPGDGVLYCLAESGRVHILVARDGLVRELLVGVDLAARIRRERFGRP